MSVINTMLRNLDDRRAGKASDVTLMGDVMVPPRASVPPVRATVLLLPLMVGALVLATLYFWPRTHNGYLPKPVTIDVGTTAVMPITGSASRASVEAVTPAPVPAQSADTSADAPKTITAEPVDLLSLATSLEHADGISYGHGRSRVERRDVADTPVRAATAPLQQSLPVVMPAVVVVSSPAANPTIRLEQSVQTAAERNLAEVQHAADLQRRGALAEAEASLRGVLDNDKGMITARLALFSLLSRQQRNDEARKVLKDGIDIAPTQSQLVLPYARLLAARGEWSAALDALVPATDALAQDAEYRALNGAVLQRLGRFSQSSAEYRAALRLAPAAGAWWVGLGLALEGEGRQIEARSAYLQARANTLGPDLAQFVDNKLARLGTPE
jgi:MSHA biogenesis protein MshN